MHVSSVHAYDLRKLCESEGKVHAEGHAPEPSEGHIEDCFGAFCASPTNRSRNSRRARVVLLLQHRIWATVKVVAHPLRLTYQNSIGELLCAQLFN